MIGLEQLSKRYGYGVGHIRMLLCRPEFNQFRESASNYFTFDDSKNFHIMLKHILDLKKNKHYNCRLKILLLLILFFNTQLAFCQQYEPVIIYSPTGEPQAMIKGHIIYSPHGQPKKYTNRTMDKK